MTNRRYNIWGLLQFIQMKIPTSIGSESYGSKLIISCD
jgi:hypothetical protein